MLEKPIALSSLVYDWSLFLRSHGVEPRTAKFADTAIRGKTFNLIFVACSNSGSHQFDEDLRSQRNFCFQSSCFR
ncbi:hypothetical protein K1719_005118 [Acacia pycnantha]|nr:hypothetical protein K1719_005118 [Acacia pycnantha]